MKHLIRNSLLAVLILPLLLSATERTVDDIFASFQKYLVLEDISITIPTIIEVPIESQIGSQQFALYNVTEEEFEPYIIKQEKISEQPGLVAATVNSKSAFRMIDENSSTYEDFPFNNRAVNTASLVFTFDEAITSSGFSLQLDNFVALPRTVEVFALINGQQKAVLSKQGFSGTQTRFPETTSQNWVVDLTYTQPLRISEFDFLQFARSEVSYDASLRFLAQPESQYRIYYDSDRNVQVSTGEKPNLNGNEYVVIDSYESLSNPSYVIVDTDKDGVADIFDNCVRTPNADQVDANNNGRGDVCDDFDFDGVINLNDNCINEPNRGQVDTDADGIGDVCDGEESRLTEKYPWIAWGGIAMVGLILIVLIAFTVKDREKEKKEEELEEKVGEPGGEATPPNPEPEPAVDIDQVPKPAEDSTNQEG
jgi:hypothetical protein